MPSFSSEYLTFPSILLPIGIFLLFAWCTWVCCCIGLIRFRKLHSPNQLSIDATSPQKAHSHLSKTSKSLTKEEIEIQLPLNTPLSVSNDSQEPLNLPNNLRNPIVLEFKTEKTDPLDILLEQRKTDLYRKESSIECGKSCDRTVIRKLTEELEPIDDLKPLDDLKQELGTSMNETDLFLQHLKNVKDISVTPCGDPIIQPLENISLKVHYTE